MSGTAFANWALSNRVVTESRTVATSLGCAPVFNDSTALKQCLRGKSVEEIQAAAGGIVRIILANLFIILGILEIPLIHRMNNQF